jgi:NifB/MoaA-like Fe-S oxidoreductase
VITGRLAGPFLEEALGSVLGRVPGLTVSVRQAGNSLMGPTVTVAGLLPGRDLAEAISAENEADLILLPSVAFNDDGLTLDGMTLEQLTETSGRASGSVVVAGDIVDVILRFAGPERPRGAGGRNR